MRLVVGAVLLLASTLPADEPTQPQARYCREMRVTGYVRTDFSSRTYDGTSIYSDEPLAAASWDIPIDSYVWVEGWGVYRVADRGHLGSNGWIDLAVWTRSEAYEATGYRMVCVSPP